MHAIFQSLVFTFVYLAIVKAMTYQLQAHSASCLLICCMQRAVMILYMLFLPMCLLSVRRIVGCGGNQQLGDEQVHNGVATCHDSHDIRIHACNKNI